MAVEPPQQASSGRLAVVIAGAGFCGTLTAAAGLGSRGAERLRAMPIERGAMFGRGPVYRRDLDPPRLRVLESSRRTLVDAVNHFVAWCRRIEPVVQAVGSCRVRCPA